MKLILRVLAFLAWLIFCMFLPVVGQVRPVVRPELKAIADSMVPPAPLISTNGSASTQLRNRLAARLDSLSRVKLDTVRVVVPVGDTVIPLPPEDTVVLPIPPDPPTGEQFTDTLRGVRTGDVVCPDGRSCLVGVLEVQRGSLRTVNGRIVLRDGSRLRFTGGDPNAYVGGGQFWTPELGRTDFGLWVGGPDATGQLDIACTPKTGWGRTAQISDWSSGDELWVAPVAFRDFQVRRYTLGQPVPRADSTLPPAEIANVTRGCSISGTGHIHIHSSPPIPHRILYVRLDSLGVTKNGQPVLGRYALHDHMSGEGSRGTVVRGVALTNARGEGFVPHASHGITYVDNVCVNVRGRCLWWDLGHPTNDFLADHMLALGVDTDASSNGNVQAFTLGAGDRMEIRNSAAVAVCPSDLGQGFDWPEMPVLFTPEPSPVWTFSAGNVAHNNCGAGIKFWNNNNFPHVVEDYVGYHNAVGIENGAYANPNRYRNVRLYRDGFGGWFASFIRPAVIWQTNSNTVGSVPGGIPGGMQGVVLLAAEGPAITVGHRNVPGTAYARFANVSMIPAPGQPKLLILEGGHPWRAEFVSSSLAVTDVLFANPSGSGGEGSEVRIDNDGNGTFECRVWVEGGQQRSRCN